MFKPSPNKRMNLLMDSIENAMGTKQLNWKNKQVTGEEVLTLARLNASFAGSKMWENLWLAGNRITDASLVVLFSLLLKHCNRVKVLDLRSNSITDFGIDLLLAFIKRQRETLRVLYMDNNLISDAGYARIMAILPETKVQVFTTSVQVIPRDVLELVMRSNLKRLTVDQKASEEEQEQLKRALALSGKWVGTVMAFASLRTVRRLTFGAQPCYASMLPNELVRMLSTFL